jgi:imidazolonepropionase-like amidohydrolase
LKRCRSLSTHRVDSLEPGKQADLLGDSSNIAHLPYFFARNPVRHVIKRGRTVV